MHTPGPWRYSHAGDGGDVLTPDGRRVATVHGYYDEEIQQGKANGCLIAAAPELLTALAQLVADADQGSLVYEHSDRRESRRDVETARALLARIEG
jgi:hypothetical protein